MAAYAHLLLTRFNVPVAYADAKAGLDEEWLRHRFELFERFCLPSVRSQTRRDFQWLVFFHADTPGEWKARIRAHAAGGAFRPVFVREFARPAVFRALCEALPERPQILVTSRLDNDDALSRHFVAEVQRNLAGRAPYFLNFPRGYTWVDGRAYLYRHPSNAFLTLVEPVSEWAEEAVRTVWCCEHLAAASVAPVRQLPSPPAWLQVIHGRNVANRRVGVRRPLRHLRAEFELPALAEEGRVGEGLWWLEAAGGWMRRALGRAARLARGVRTP